MADYWWPLKLAGGLEVYLMSGIEITLPVTERTLEWMRLYAPDIERAVAEARPYLKEFGIVSDANQLGCYECFCGGQIKKLPRNVDVDGLNLVISSEYAHERARNEAIEILDRLELRRRERERKHKTRSQMSASYVRTFRKVIERDGYVCKVCGATKDLQVDHIHPVSKDGTNELSNLQLLCRKCNLKKGAKGGDE